jgi:hypothetical protein
VGAPSARDDFFAGAVCAETTETASKRVIKIREVRVDKAAPSGCGWQTA